MGYYFGIIVLASVFLNKFLSELNRNQYILFYVMPRKRPNELCECDWSNRHTSTVYKWGLRHTRHKENNIY